MQQYVALDQDGRTKRRTVADALEVVRQRLGVVEITRAEIRLAPFALPWGGSTAAVVVLFPDLGCYVSLPASARFGARTDTSPQRQAFEIALLEGAEICSDGSVLLKDGSRLRAVEVEPTGLHRPSALDERILGHVIAHDQIVPLLSEHSRRLAGGLAASDSLICARSTTVASAQSKCRHSR